MNIKIVLYFNRLNIGVTLLESIELNQERTFEKDELA